MRLTPGNFNQIKFIIYLCVKIELKILGGVAHFRNLLCIEIVHRMDFSTGSLNNKYFRKLWKVELVCANKGTSEYIC